MPSLITPDPPTFIPTKINGIFHHLSAAQPVWQTLEKRGKLSCDCKVAMEGKRSWR